mgnify:CR=1 FL=1
MTQAIKLPYHPNMNNKYNTSNFNLGSISVINYKIHPTSITSIKFKPRYKLPIL